MFSVDTDDSSEEELLSAELTTESGKLSATETINSLTKFPNKINAVIGRQGEQIRMQLDSGASWNFLPKKHLPVETIVQKTNKQLTAYTKEQITALGTARVSICNPKTRKKYNAEFVVVDWNCMPLIGVRAAEQMGLILVLHHKIQLVSSSAAPSNPQCSSLKKEQVK